MYDFNTGTFSDGNVPFEQRDYFREQTGLMNPRETTDWERDLVELECILLHEPDLEQ